MSTQCTLFMATPARPLSGRAYQLACTSLPFFTGSREFCLFRKQKTLLLWGDSHWNKGLLPCSWLSLLSPKQRKGVKAYRLQPRA